MSIAEKFNIPPALLETIRKMNAEETEYQMKVKALMKKRGITSLSQLSPEEKKDFFNTLDAMHKAKNEEVERIDEMDKSQPSTPRGAEGLPVGKKADPVKTDKVKSDALKVLQKQYKKEEVELEDEMINEDLMKLDPVTNTLVGLATAAGASLLFFDYWFGKDKDMRKPIEKGMAKAKKDGNSKLYHSLAAKYYEDQVTKSTKALNKLRSDPKSFYKKDSDKTGAKTGDMKKFEKRAEEELLRVIEIAKKKQKEFEAKEKSGEAITKKYYESVQHIEENVKTEPPFTPDKPKKNPGVIPGKSGVGPSRAAHLAKMALKKQLKKEEVELDESKSSTGYDLYHKDFSSAMQHAYDFAKKKYNIEIDPLEIDRNVAMGPRKPGSGKANAYRLLDKTGKKAIQVQVANLDNKRYELNMYKEDVQIDEVAASKPLQKAHDDERKKRGLPDPSYYLKLAAQKKKEIEDMKKETQKEEAGASKKKEDAFHNKLDKLVHKTFGHSSDEKKMKKEEFELTESHFKVGQRVKCLKSGMSGTVTKIDKPEEGKYYTVKQDSGKVMKYAPDELKALKESVEEAKNPQTSMKRAALSMDRAKEVVRHQKEIGTIRRKRESLRNSFDPESNIEEKVLWPGTPEYKKKHGTDKEKHELKYGKSDAKKLKPYGYRDNDSDKTKIVREAIDKMKKKKNEATAKESKKDFKSGDKLSGKTEPIEINPELKEQKT